MYYEERKILFSGAQMMNLAFKRKISKSMGNRSSVITIPRTIARSWEQYETVNLIFEGSCLVISPTDTGSDNA
jgi:hypothetical protein